MADLTPKEARELWAQALEGGEYQQGDGQLTRSTDDGEVDCCLGVACKEAVKRGIIQHFDGQDGDLQMYKAVQKWLGLRTSAGDYRLSGSDLDARCLTSDNDGGQTFQQIAATIRAEPEGLVTA